MQRFHRLAVIPMLVAFIWPGHVSSASGLERQWSVDLLALQGRAHRQNVLKLFSAAVDPVRSRVYVAGIMTPHIGVLDAVTDRILGTLDSGIEDGGLKYLHLDPVSGDLYVLDATHRELRRIEVASGRITGPVRIPGSAGNLAIDSGRRLLYFTTRESPGLRAYDGATLETVWTQGAMGEGTGPLVYDRGEDVIYVLDISATEGIRPIHRVDAATGRMLEPLTYRAQGRDRSRFLARDPATGRFFVGTSRILLVLDRQGRELRGFSLTRGREASRLAYLPGRDLLAVLSLELPEGGEVAGVGGHLEAYAPATGAKVEDLGFGLKPQRMAVDPASGRIWIPNGDASVVWKIDTATFGAPTRIRLGDSMEGVVRAADGRVYGTSRLGGSYLLSYDPVTRAYRTFSAGTWPIPIRTDDSGEHLLVLNAWDSTLSVFAVLPELRPLATIPVGLPAGTTDRLPDMAVDSEHGLAFAAYPEHGKVAVVNWVARRSEAVLTVPGARGGDTGGGPGQLQVAVHEGAYLLYVWSARERTLAIFDGAQGWALRGSVNLSTLDLSRVEGAPDDPLLFVDEEEERLFLGPFELDPLTGRPTGRSLSRGQLVLGVDPATGDYWTVGVESASGGLRDRLAALGREDLGVLWVEDLGAVSNLLPHHTLDAESRTLLVADPVLPGLSAFAPASEEPCEPAQSTLCLGGDRFRVEVTWQGAEGGQESARAFPLTADTGAFWFSSENNLELMVKVLDGRSLNGHFWVFYGALSDLEFNLRVTDVVTGASRSYHNPAGTMASRGDVLALRANDEIPLGGSGELTCAEEPGPLRLGGGRFEVEVTWTSFEEESGGGVPCELEADSGGFWFFSPDNLELMVKVLDGRSVNGNHWVFYGALSNVAYRLTVTDTENGATVTYDNPAGHFASVGDIDALAGDL